jgi:fibronectin type 3 domain-containing protein
MIPGGTFMRSFLISLVLIGALFLSVFTYSAVACGGCVGPGPEISEPQDLNVTIASEGLELDWEPPEEGSDTSNIEYIVYKGENPDELECDAYGLTDTSYIDLNVEIGIEYYYSVQASNGYYGGPMSETVCEIFVTPATAPMNLSAVCAKGYIELHWDRPLDDGGDPDLMYNVYCGEEYEEIYRVATRISEMSFNNTGLNNHLTYQFTVSSVNKAGECEFSNTLVASPMHLPTQPLNLTSTVGDGYVHLDWEPPEDAGGEPDLRYDVYKGIKGQKLASAKEGIADTDFKCTGLTNGIPYYFRIKSVNLLGESLYSEKLYATPVGCPSQPLDLSYEYGDHCIHLEWSGPVEDGGDENIKYNVYVAEEANNYILVGEEIAQDNYTVTLLENGREYQFKVVSVNSNGEGDSTNPIHATPMTTPHAPVNPKARPSPGSVELSWEEPINLGGCDEVKYHVQVFEPESQRDPIKDHIVEGSGVTITGLQGGIEYEFHISCINSVGEGPSVTIGSIAYAPIPKEEPEEVDPETPEPVQEEQKGGSGNVFRPWDMNLVPAFIISSAVIFAAILVIIVMLEVSKRQRKKD